MKFCYKILLVGPHGDKERWTILSKKLPKGTYGYTCWESKEIQLNERLRNPKMIEDTIYHEIVHVTAGQNGSEELAINVEQNNRRVRNLLEKTGIYPPLQGSSE